MGSGTKARPQHPGTQIQVRLQPDDLADLDRFRAAEADLPSRPEALRRLAAEALQRRGLKPVASEKTNRDGEKQDA